MLFKNKNLKSVLFAVICITFVAVSCTQRQSKQGKEQDTATSGTIRISVDETYQPLIEAEIKVFQSLYPKTKIIAEYKPEIDCFKDLFNDSARMIIVTRDLKPEEREYFKKEKIRPQCMQLATDAVALVVNNANPDSILTMDQVRQIMTGKAEKPWQIVFDNQNSSTVRFIQDSINKGAPLPATTMAAKTNPEVIDYITKNKNAIGVIGVNWISDTSDPKVIDFNTKVTTVKLRGDGYTDFVKPYQFYIGMKSYPLTRGMFYVLKEPYQGLGAGFATFLGGQEGQLLIGRYKLYPARLNIVFREATLK
ncbi:phosphate ABC transporter substrate-binding protein, PhoT family [Chitinophaga lutea]|uniref:Phosphate ABC transporter substrate-binding protein, PhoT family n=1 Tax=Chitinophaga lutea TaxID=2488634 RepID=A0A3N4PMJ5_9BACT|nr:substrate-binding domain-containing protein [Chitinophaga lutea]RPE09913.1 phosphate ABC transporter substrate-binding protein, PhoT family [Chitinophaga lutea]